MILHRAAGRASMCNEVLIESTRLSNEANISTALELTFDSINTFLLYDERFKIIIMAKLNPILFYGDSEVIKAIEQP